MKNYALIAACLMLLLSTTGCTRDNTNNSLPPVTVSSAPGLVVPESSIQETEKNEFRQSNENVEMVLTMAKPRYTLGEFVDVTIKLTNIGDTPLAYVQGSGSNKVPDALNVQIGDLISVYKPQITTNDYRTHILQPGESVEFSTPFVPYTLKGDEMLLPVPPDSTLEYFQTEDFAPAATGTVDGKATFTYSLAPVEGNINDNASVAVESLANIGPADESQEPGALDFIDQGEVVVLELDFTVHLTE